MNATINEKRREFRRKTLLGGSLQLGRTSTMDCCVRNLSDAGARVRLDEAASLPDEVILVVAQLGLHAPARLVWRDSTGAGLAFTQDVAA